MHILVQEERSTNICDCPLKSDEYISLNTQKDLAYLGVKMVGYGLSIGAIDQDWEILNETYATAYDSLNNMMVTDGKYQRLSVGKLKTMFSKLRSLARKYAPDKMHVIDRLEMYSLAHANGKLTDREFLVAVRTVAEANGLDTSLIAMAEMRVNTVEARIEKKPYNPFIYSDKPIKPRGMMPGFFPLTPNGEFFKMPKDFFGYGKTFDLRPQPKGKQVVKPIIPKEPIILFKKPLKGKPFIDIKPLDFGGKPFFDAKPLFPLGQPAKRVEAKKKPLHKFMNVLALDASMPTVNLAPPARKASVKKAPSILDALGFPTPKSSPRKAKMGREGGLKSSFLPKFELKKPRWF